MQPLRNGSGFTVDPPTVDSKDRHTLCTLFHETDEQRYQVVLKADVTSVSLEGMNRFQITVNGLHKASGQHEGLYAHMEINLRMGMSSVSIAGGRRQYFTVSGRALNLHSKDIESSIHEAVDLGLMDFRVRSKASPGSPREEKPLIFDALACNLLKASMSALIAQATVSHRQVIQRAGQIFACREDYIRDMCSTMASHADQMARIITDKALNCDQGLF